MRVAARQDYGWDARAPLLELDFPEAVFVARLDRVRARMAASGLDVLAVWEEGAGGHNVRYLSGFAMPTTWIGGSLVLVHRERDPVLLTSAVAHGEPMHSNIQTTWFRDVRGVAGQRAADMVAAAGEVLAAWGADRLHIGFFEPDRLPHDIRQGFEAAWATQSLQSDHGILRAERRIKTGEEIAVLRRLGRITSIGMEAAMQAVRPGAREADVAAAAHAGCIAAGAEQMTFGCYAVAGRRSALKNVPPRADKAIQPGELVMIDLGCKLAGYQSDMSRNVVAGSPDAPLRAMLEACLAALDAGKAAIRPGMRDIDVPAAMRAEIARHGFAQWDWSICHGYGLELAEAPMFSRGAPSVLEAGMCFYVEPMIVPPEIGSVCLEDMIVVTETGCEVLTSAPLRVW